MKRRITKLVVFLLLGAIVNVAVAWGCARWPGHAVWISGNEPRFLSGEDVAWWNNHVRSQFGYEVADTVICNDVGFRLRFLVGHPSLPSKGSAARLFAGWPAHAVTGSMWCFTQRPKASPRWNCQGIYLDPELKYALPLHPIWPGFAINTIFYGAIFWLLAFGPFTARRIIRRKRGHCIKCGYDLESLIAHSPITLPPNGAAACKT